MNLRKKVCPYCGKRLVLTAPRQEYLPQAVGRNNQGILFITLSTERVMSYDECPDAMGGNIIDGRKFFEAHDIDEEGPLGVGRVAIRDIERELKKKIVRRDVIYQCAGCMNTVAVNRSFRAAKMMNRKLAFLPPLTELAVVLFAPALTPPVVLAITGVLLIITLLMLFGNTILNAYYNRRENNFVPVTELDCLAELPTLLTLEVKKLPKKYLRKCNLLTAEIGGERFALYITEVSGSTAGAFICGIKNEPERLIEIIEACKKTVKRPLLELYFEDRWVGSAEVTAVHPISEDYAPPQTLVVLDPKVWYCKKCGYANQNTAHECRSCGGYK